eukprot:1031659-Pleurochrysis_carterae.AAC.5
MSPAASVGSNSTPSSTCPNSVYLPSSRREPEGESRGSACVVMKNSLDASLYVIGEWTMPREPAAQKGLRGVASGGKLRVSLCARADSSSGAYTGSVPPKGKTSSGIKR